GIMIGRSCMGNPWLFREIAVRFRGEPDPPKPTVDERLDAVLRHADMMVMRKGEALGLREFRKHVVSYMKAFPFARELKTKLMDAVTLEEYHTIINDGRDAIRTKAEADANRPKYEGDECEPTDCGCDD
ncbi:MAG TPA: tRNA-dihydrouridine synthase, partial [Candidatus Sumerlaeota bacterium]|nr:tRNA-dihydrouridine synthase [Candidatus Sumerlaeota bacterium]